MTIVPGGTSITRSSAPRPCLLLPLPCEPLSARQKLVLGQGGQVVDAVLGDDDHAAAVAAVAAVGPALGDVLLAPEADAAVAAAASLDFDSDAIDEHGFIVCTKAKGTLCADERP